MNGILIISFSRRLYSLNSSIFFNASNHPKGPLNSKQYNTESRWTIYYCELFRIYGNWSVFAAFSIQTLIFCRGHNICKMEQFNISAPLIVSLGYLWNDRRHLSLVFTSDRSIRMGISESIRFYVKWKRTRLKRKLIRISVITTRFSVPGP